MIGFPVPAVFDVQKRYYCIPYFLKQRIKDPRVYKAENIHRGKGCAKAARSQAIKECFPLTTRKPSFSILEWHGR